MGSCEGVIPDVSVDTGVDLVEEGVKSGDDLWGGRDCIIEVVVGSGMR